MLEMVKSTKNIKLRKLNHYINLKLKVESYITKDKGKYVQKECLVGKICCDSSVTPQNFFPTR